MALGKPDPYAMLDEMPQGVFEQWWKYSEVEPFANQNIQLASILSVLTGKDVYQFGVSKKPTTIQDARAIFKTMGLME